ncbi:hypothetical protein Q1M63_05970 (plasmid) [Sinorhizobium meliloti]|nr:hypothetical protein Q1M63_05970 [Sinorhizobium meliloti]
MPLTDRVPRQSLWRQSRHLKDTALQCRSYTIVRDDVCRADAHQNTYVDGSHDGLSIDEPEDLFRSVVHSRHAKLRDPEENTLDDVPFTCDEDAALGEVLVHDRSLLLHFG